MADPITDRLLTDYERALTVARKSSYINIQKVLGNPPRKYEILFNCRGIKKIVNNKPETSENHLFEISFGPKYPHEKPIIVCTTDIFHPNISSSGSVCIGNEWHTGGRYLDDLIIYLAQMIRYEGLDLTFTNHNTFAKIG